jgi:hypothetical protein
VGLSGHWTTLSLRVMDLAAARMLSRLGEVRGRGVREVAVAGAAACVCWTAINHKDKILKHLVLSIKVSVCVCVCVCMCVRECCHCV